MIIAWLAETYLPLSLTKSRTIFLYLTCFEGSIHQSYSKTTPRWRYALIAEPLLVQQVPAYHHHWVQLHNFSGAPPDLCFLELVRHMSVTKIGWPIPYLWTGAIMRCSQLLLYHIFHSSVWIVGKAHTPPSQGLYQKSGTKYNVSHFLSVMSSLRNSSQRRSPIWMQCGHLPYCVPLSTLQICNWT